LKIAERILDLLEKKNIQPVDFADMLGIFEEKIREWQWGHCLPTLAQIIKISDYLNVTTDYLLKGEVQKELNLRCPVCEKKIKLKITPPKDKIT